MRRDNSFISFMGCVDFNMIKEMIKQGKLYWMKERLRTWVLIILSFLFVVVVGGVGGVWAEYCEEYKDGDETVYLECLGREMDKLSKELQMSREATAPLEEELDRLRKKIASFQYQIDQAKARQDEIGVEIREREDLLSEQYLILAEKTREYYKRLRSTSLLSQLLSSMGTGESTREMTYRNDANERDRQIILQLSGEIGGLEKDKIELEEQKGILAGLQTELDKEVDFYGGEVAKAKDYQSVLSSQIASLTAKQQAILSEKQGTFQTTVGDVPLADDPNSRPDYNPGFSPAFAAFSFGAPHFKGMSQYGAFGRAKSGQTVEEILRAYYGGGVEIKKDYDSNKEIGVAGYGRMSIETYVKRIYEVPNSWGDEGGMEALKAQAVAARSYALAWTREGTGGNICTDQGCQVYKNSDKGGNWEQAVNDTRGWVLMKDGKVVSSWYASTSGGYQESYDALNYLHDGSSYNTPAFWDTNNGRSGWTSEAYEKIAGSPWFYKGWYKRRDGDTCGRSHPWLTSEEMADVLNAWVALYQGGGDSTRVTPESDCWGGNPYNKDELRSIGGFSSVSGVSVQYSEAGVTANVTFTTNKGSKTITGSEFYKAFNLRAPARIALKSGLFNIESK